MIHFEDKMTFDIPVQKAWDIINDKELIAKCIPTLKTYRIVDDDHVEGIVKIQLGLIPVESRISMEVIERVAPSRVVGKGVSYLGESIAAQVKEVKPGAVNKDSVGIFTVTVELQPDGAAKTFAKASIEVQAEGKLKRIYDSIMEKKLPALRAEFIQKIQAVISEKAGEAPAAAQVALPQATETVSYSFFGKIVNFIVGLINRILERGEQVTR